MEWAHESPRRSLSKKDRRLRTKDVESSVRHSDDNVEALEAYRAHLDATMRRYYPSVFGKFNPPTPERILDDLKHAVSIFSD